MSCKCDDFCPCRADMGETCYGMCKKDATLKELLSRPIPLEKLTPEEIYKLRNICDVEIAERFIFRKLDL